MTRKPSVPLQKRATLVIHSPWANVGIRAADAHTLRIVSQAPEFGRLIRTGLFVQIDDASQDSELNTTMQDAMWRGHGGWEMALTPVLFGLGGWAIDGWLGTGPFVMIAAAIVGLGGSVANQYYRYNDRMTALEQVRRDGLAASAIPGAPRFGKTEASV